MRTWRIAWKEFLGFLMSPLAYIFLVLFVLAMAGGYFVIGTRTGNFFSETTTEMGGFFRMVPWAFVILIPALSMKLWPDELKSGTLELLASYPLRSHQIVLGKFLGGFLLVLCALAATIASPIVVSGYGSLDWGPVIGAYLGSALMGAAFLSVGLFMGALCREQVTAFILTAGICLLFVLMGDTLFNMFLSREWTVPLIGITIPLQELSNGLSFTNRFDTLGRGLVSLKDVAYFLSFGVVFLVLNISVVECRKGR